MNTGRLMALLLCLSLVGCADSKSPDDDWSGRWVVINYWAEWCKPCLTEIPELNEFAEHNRDTSVVVGVNYDGVQGADLDRLIAKFDIRFQVIDDPAGRLGYPRPTVLPTTMIIDPHGNIKETLLGPQTLASLQAAID